MVMSDLIGLIPLAPLLGFLFIGLVNRNLTKGWVSFIACGSVFVSFVISIALFIGLLNAPEGQSSLTFTAFDWISAGNFSVSFSFLVDPLSSLMMLIITGVGFLIHVYSVGYMHDDDGFHRFFMYLNLFIFFMLLLVMGSNYLLMFVGWEGVGLCSYLLIGFWFKNQDYNDAAKKAFIMNRIGDLGLILGVILIFIHFGSINYQDVFAKAGEFPAGAEFITWITILLFVGAIGKSAQIPLYTWLPDAMAGPTPVSALIHAATMVTAGIYMIARNNVLYTLAPFSLEIVTIIGLATAVFAATIAIAQTDIKKVLAYSTVSQLGLMFVALGVGAYTTGIFHMATHAFFKALLFLGAGSVIHGLSGEQDLRNMGGLRKYLPVTFLTFLIGTLAIAGIPPFAGFFSKDEILANAFAHSPVIWGFAAFASLLTAFYMFRLFFLTFSGSTRASEEVKHHIHESPKSMTVPLMVLAVLSLVGGFMGVPEVLGGSHALNHFLDPVFAQSKALSEAHHHLDHNTEFTLMGTIVGLTLVMILIAYFMYVRGRRVPAPDTVTLNAAHKLVRNKYYIDELYNAVIVKPLNVLSKVFDSLVEKLVIDNIVNGTGKVVTWSSKTLRLIQTGNTAFYIFAMVISIIILLAAKSLI
ncbi:NADH-quinone oxidoreductase subunit L [Fulvivirgaceae bacterium PWU4]|uniref:NADH-quinone oxidoreductase subunit L n=1 Tax=Chryseosolibacter histidini TaxID=2782349 RepID=A0AAP2GJ63_9BACT|nr:NADH-quinone oxidoreductase subunit L [Chryseosolibacter histidini]MBT1698001.1 NADH-quinone oxidoreductase subunit L [Chryseosolibacter histidini]